jgi:hypothetical protein
MKLYFDGIMTDKIKTGSFNLFKKIIIKLTLVSLWIQTVNFKMEMIKNGLH